MADTISSDAYAALKTENEFLKRKQSQSTVTKGKSKQESKKKPSRLPSHLRNVEEVAAILHVPVMNLPKD